jgi:hypothetical protein
MSRKILAVFCLFAVSINVNAQWGDLLKNIAEDVAKDVVIGALAKKGDSKSGDDDNQKIDCENDDPSQSQEGSDKVCLDTSASIVYAHVLGTKIAYKGERRNDLRPYTVDFSDISAHMHPERQIDGGLYPNYVAFNHEMRGRPEADFVRVVEVRQQVNEYINNHANSNERYFEGRWINEVNNNDSYPIALTKYRDRISTVVSDVERIMGDDLEMWKQYGHFDVIWDPKVVKGRLEWICDNVFDDIAIDQLSYLALVTALTEEEFCEETKNYSATRKSSLLANHLQSPFSLDPTRMSDPETGFNATPYNVSNMLVLLGGEIWDEVNFGMMLEGNITREKLRTFISVSLSRISFDVVHSAYFGVAPLTSFDTYQTMLRDATRWFLLSNIGSEKDIDARIMSTDLKEEDYSILIQSISGEELSGKEKRILSFYEKRFANFEIIEKEKAEKNRIAKLNAIQEKYLGLSMAFAKINQCYQSRKGYAAVYINEQEYSSAKRTFEQKSAAVKLSEDLKSQVRDKAEKAVTLFGNWGSNYKDETRKDCEMSLFLLNNA